MGDKPNQDDFSNDIEGDVNDLIAEAQALSNNLADEVGANDRENSPRDSEFFESATDSEASLDTQIAQADAALREAAEELGFEPSPAPKKTISLPTKKTSSPPAGETQGAAAAEAAPQTVTLPARTPPGPKGQNAPSGADKLVAAKLSEVPFELESKQPSRMAELAGKLRLPTIRNHAEPALHGMCTVFEALDRPFQKVGLRYRAIMGWIAVAFAVAALSLYYFVVL